MRDSIFKKASKLKDLVYQQGEARQYAFFSFREIKDAPVVCLEIDGITRLKSCTCTHCSVNSIHNPLCSYKSAVNAYLVEKSVATPPPQK